MDIRSLIDRCLVLVVWFVLFDDLAGESSEAQHKPSNIWNHERIVEMKYPVSVRRDYHHL